MTQTIQELAPYQGQLFPTHIPDLLWNGFNAAIVNGGTLAIGAGLAQKQVRVVGLTLSSSIAGRYQIGGAATIVLEVRLVANQMLEVYFGPLGVVFPDVASGIYFYNQSGSSAAMGASVWGYYF